MATLLKNNKFKLSMRKGRVLITLAPDFKGDKHVQYLSYERAKSYGLNNDTAPYLEIRLMFTKGDDVVRELTAMQYTNTYDVERGFLSVNVDRHALIAKTPEIGEYDTISVFVATRDEYKMIQRHKASELK